MSGDAVVGIDPVGCSEYRRVGGETGRGEREKC